MPADPIPALTEWEACLAAARAGCPDALGRLLQSVRPLLLLAARDSARLDLQAKAGASDLVQESLAEGHRDFAAFRGQRPEELTAWLRRILAHNVANFRRRYHGTAKRVVGKEIPLPDDPSSSCGVGLSVPTPGPVESAARREELARLEAAITGLPELSQQVLRWRHREGLGFEEIGQRLDRTPEAARQVWWRAVEALRRRLDG